MGFHALSGRPEFLVRLLKGHARKKDVKPLAKPTRRCIYFHFSGALTSNRQLTSTRRLGPPKSRRL